MNRKTLVVLAVLAIALAVATVSIEAQRGGGGSRGGGSGGSGGGMHPEPNVNDNTNGNFPPGNYDVPAGGCGNFNGNYELPPGNYGPGNYEALDVCVSTDKRTYIEGETIKIEVKAYNPLDSPIRIVTDTCLIPLSYVIDGYIGHEDFVDENGTNLGGVTCAALPTIYVLQPHQTVSRNFIRDAGTYWVDPYVPLPVGRHGVVGKADVKGPGPEYTEPKTPKYSDPITINVLTPIDGDNPETVPTVAWVRTYGAAGSLVARGVAVDSEDNVVVAGSSWFQGMELGDYYTIKYDSAGNQLWVKAYDGGGIDEAYGIAIDSDGNVYVTGSSGTIKYTPEGNLLWTKRYYDWRGHDFAYGVAADSEGNVIVTGRSNYDYYTVKYDPDGDLLWAKTYGGNGVAVDSNDNVIVTGYSSGTIKYDPEGNQLWIGGSGGNGVAIDSEGNVIVTGSGTIKYDSNGNQLWTASYGGRGVAIDSDGNVYVIGTSNADYLTIKYDSNGNQLWNLTYDTGGDDWAYGVAVDSDDNVIVTGILYFGGSTDYLTIKYVMPAANMHMRR